MKSEWSQVCFIVWWDRAYDNFQVTLHHCPHKSHVHSLTGILKLSFHFLLSLPNTVSLLVPRWGKVFGCGTCSWHPKFHDTHQLAYFSGLHFFTKWTVISITFSLHAKHKMNILLGVHVCLICRTTQWISVKFIIRVCTSSCQVNLTFVSTGLI